MYSLYAPMWDTDDILIKLLKEVLGYTDDEIKFMESEWFRRNIVNNLTIEQAKKITEIFTDNDFQIYLNKGGGLEDVIYWKDLGIKLNHEPPKKHYCDRPLVSREHLADLSIPKKIDEPITEPIMMKKSSYSSKPIVTCPYCKSTNTKKITNTSKAVHTALFGIFSIGRNSKNYRCINCKSEW